MPFVLGGKADLLSAEGVCTTVLEVLHGVGALEQ